MDKNSVVANFATVHKEGELNEESNVQILHIANSDKPVRFEKLLKIK